ncbi:GNAT family N-acetyltransferase [Bacillus horti]|uniref:Ribosomal-protein-alanine N-acetyltransferase n=1 Tax=Caldalkalibacillus horti TaxID=77523 RepID=A0ABT9W0J8_9BACI|nr:GNAT family N-acetyltransferase [Bacillus horti]MDQ0166780.1 ribosomal-protein-alanine N-acetyltransferase [Bacillus horti]
MINYSGTVKIDTERLVLRQFTIEDVESAYKHWLSDERVSDNRVSPAHIRLAETSKRISEIINQYTSPEYCWWALELKEDGNLIGEIYLYEFEAQTSNCEVGYSLGYEWWNKGYGTEALKAVIGFAFRHMRVHKISAAHNTDNPASGRVMMKAGMKQEGVIRHMIRNSKNQYKDCAVYGILDEDFYE